MGCQNSIIQNFGFSAKNSIECPRTNFISRIISINSSIFYAKTTLLRKKSLFDYCIFLWSSFFSLCFWKVISSLTQSLGIGQILIFWTVKLALKGCNLLSLSDNTTHSPPTQKNSEKTTFLKLWNDQKQNEIFKIKEYFSKDCCNQSYEPPFGFLYI